MHPSQRLFSPHSYAETSLSKSAVEVPICSRTVGIGPFILMTKSPAIVLLIQTSQFKSHMKKCRFDDLPIEGMAKGEIVALLFNDLELI